MGARLSVISLTFLEFHRECDQRGVRGCPQEADSAGICPPGGFRSAPSSHLALAGFVAKQKPHQGTPPGRGIAASTGLIECGVHGAPRL